MNSDFTGMNAAACVTLLLPSLLPLSRNLQLRHVCSFYYYYYHQFIHVLEGALLLCVFSRCTIFMIFKKN